MLEGEPGVSTVVFFSQFWALDNINIIICLVKEWMLCPIRTKGTRNTNEILIIKEKAGDGHDLYYRLISGETGSIWINSFIDANYCSKIGEVSIL